MSLLQMQVQDAALRSTLIQSAKSLEKLLKNGTLKLGQAIRNEADYGLQVDVLIETIKEDRPLIYTYNYALNTLKFKAWLESKPTKLLCEGPLAFTAKGIQVMVHGGAAKWDKTAFSINNKKGERHFLELLHEEISFTVHRDLFSGEEWEVLMDDPHSKSNSMYDSSAWDDVPF